MLERAAKQVVEAIKRSFGGARLIEYVDLPDQWRTNPFVTRSYRFVPIERWPLLIMSVFALHNETLNIHTHLLPFVAFSFTLIPGVYSSSLTDTPETTFIVFAMLCLLSSSIWHTMSGCAHPRGMELCARIDYVGIGWLISASVGTVVHYGLQCHPIARKYFLGVCFLSATAGTIFPFMNWFNSYEYRKWRILFFLILAFSAVGPLAYMSVLHSPFKVYSFIRPVIPSLISYLTGLVFYITHIPERWLPERWRHTLDFFGGGSHAIWHGFIVLAISQHKSAIAVMRVGMMGGCGSA